MVEKNLWFSVMKYGKWDGTGYIFDLCDETELNITIDGEVFTPLFIGAYKNNNKREVQVFVSNIDDTEQCFVSIEFFSEQQKKRIHHQIVF